MHEEQRPENSNETTWVTATDLAERHKVAPKTIRLMARQGRIPAVRWGKVWRFPLEEVERQLLGQATGSMTTT